jgi:hypothetical protein
MDPLALDQEIQRTEEKLQEMLLKKEKLELRRNQLSVLGLNNIQLTPTSDAFHALNRGVLYPPLQPKQGPDSCSVTTESTFSDQVADVTRLEDNNYETSDARALSETNMTEMEIIFDTEENFACQLDPDAKPGLANPTEAISDDASEVSESSEFSAYSQVSYPSNASATES